MSDELSRQAALQQALLGSAGPAVFSTTEDGVITGVSRGAEQLLGYAASELVGERTPILWHDGAEVAARAEELTRELGRSIAPGFDVLVAKAQGRGETREWTYVRKDGVRVPVLVSVSAVRNDNGALSGFLGVTQDLTERTRLDTQRTGDVKALADFKAALDEHAIVAITDAHGKITYVNDKFCAISQYAREELLGRDHRIINSGHHSKEFIRELWETIRSGRVWKGELKNRAKDGTFYWVDTSIVPFLDEQGTPTQYIAIRADITERKSVEVQIAQLNAELRVHAAQLEAANRELESFAYSVSHDLRGPLRGMDGFSQALLEDYASQLDATGRDYLHRIRAASQRMGQLIDDLLNLSRVTRTEMTLDRVDLTALARRVIAELRPQQAGRAVQWEVGDSLRVRGDPRLLRIALENLLGNALKFTGKCKQARIECGQQVQCPEQPFFVRDNGAGFDMAFANRIFGAFQRLHTPLEFPGTGIGLATVQRIIHRHGGRIWAEAQPGKGATFFFTLPTPL